jgi:hypothetical protein
MNKKGAEVRRRGVKLSTSARGFVYSNTNPAAQSSLTAGKKVGAPSPQKSSLDVDFVSFLVQGGHNKADKRISAAGLAEESTDNLPRGDGE